MDEYKGFWVNGHGYGYAWSDGDGYGDGLSGRENGNGEGEGLKYIDEDRQDMPHYLFGWKVENYIEG